MTRTTISERVLAYLKEQPGTPVEIAKALPLKRRHTRMGYTYYWGHWSFGRAESEGLIVWRGEKWHLVKRNPFTSIGLDLLFEARRTDDMGFLKQWSRDAVAWYESEKGRLIKLYEKLSSEYKAMAERALDTRKELDELKDKLKAIKTHLNDYPDEKDEKYSMGRPMGLPHPAGSSSFNSVYFLTNLETWITTFKDILEVET